MQQSCISNVFSLKDSSSLWKKTNFPKVFFLHVKSISFSNVKIATFLQQNEKLSWKSFHYIIGSSLEALQYIKSSIVQTLIGKRDSAAISIISWVFEGLSTLSTTKRDRQPSFDGKDQVAYNIVHASTLALSNKAKM